MMHRWQMSVWKDVPDRMSPGNRKLKQGDTALHLVKWPKSGPLTTPNADEDVEQQELPFMVVGVQDSAAPLEDRLEVSYKTKYTLTIWSRNPIPWYLSKGAENLCPHKTHTQMFIAALFLIAKTWKKPRGSLVCEWINKLWHLQTIEYYYC